MQVFIRVFYLSLWELFWESKKVFFFSIFPQNANPTLFGIGLSQKLFQSHKNICFKAIENDGKSNNAPITWKEAWHQILDNWEVKTILDFQKNV